MPKLKPEMPHEGHDQHLCYLSNMGFLKRNAIEYKALIKNSQFFCKHCGRTAVDKNYLCKPVKL